MAARTGGGTRESGPRWKMSRGSQDIADVTLVCDLLSRAEGGVVFERLVGGESGKRGKEV